MNNTLEGDLAVRKENNIRFFIAVGGLLLSAVGLFTPFWQLSESGKIVQATSLSEFGFIYILTPIIVGIASFLLAYRYRFNWLWLTGSIMTICTLAIMAFLTSDSFVAAFTNGMKERAIADYGMALDFKVNSKLLMGAYFMLFGSLITLSSATRVFTKKRS